MAKPIQCALTTHVSLIRAMLDVGADHGLSASLCLMGSGIQPALLDDMAGVVSSEQEMQVIRNMQRLLGSGQALGLETGYRMHPTSYGIWGFALLSSATFAGAVAVGRRYMQLTSSFYSVQPRVTATEGQLVVDDLGLPGAVRDFLIERQMAALINIQYGLDRVNLPVKALRFKRPAPEYAHRFEALFGVAPLFDQSENVLAIEPGCINLKLPQGNPLTLRYCEETCQRSLNQRLSRSGFAGQVRDCLARQSAHLPSMPEVATELGLHPRTLRRHLLSEGLDFKALVDEVRGIVAEELLSSTSLSLEEISTRLGYTEPSSLTRAFKRWKGITPSAYRLRQA